MNETTRTRINNEISKLSTMKDKLCIAKVAINKARYKEMTGYVMHEGEYITQAELTYLEKPTTANWLKAMKSLNQNFVIAAGRSEA